MSKVNLLFAGALAAAAISVVPVANATTVQVLGAGSSALFNTASLGAYSLAGAGALHYTTKGSCTSGNCAQIFDSRQAGILPEAGNLAVVWSADQSKVWAYLSVDSVVGDRSFFAVPRTVLQLDAETETGASQQLIAASLWGADQTALPAAIYAALNNATLTAAFTDIRPEDAKAAIVRVLSPLNTTDYSGLGYNTADPNVGTPIVSSFTTSQANPVNFNINGTDPITGKPVPVFATISVGASPVVIVVNKMNASGLGAAGVTGTNPTSLRAVYQGMVCNSKELTGSTSVPNVPLTVVLREPLSGTMNTFEYTNIRVKADPDSSQEYGVNPALPNNNPLDLSCPAGNAGTGTRRRAIGTGEVIKNGILLIPDSVGYTFFSYGNVQPISGSSNFGYLTLNGIDPIQKTYTTGQLPTCANPCPATPGASFPNLRNGSYRSWSVLRAVTDGQSVNVTNYNNVSALVSAIQSNINSSVPDFVPFNPVGGDPGLLLYRSHFFQAGVAPNNGLSGEKESGGDEGGCIEKKGPAPGVLNCHQ